MFTDAPELQALAQKVMEKHKEEFGLIMSNCAIRYLWSDKAKKSNNGYVYADTTRVNDKMKAISGVDFIITFYEPNCAKLDDERMEILMHHELKHIGYDEDGNCKIIPHDVNDFASIIQEHGVNWIA